MEVIRTETIAAFDPRQWDCLAGAAGFYSSHAWLRSVESIDRQHNTEYLAIEADGRLLAALPLCWIDDDPHPRYSHSVIRDLLDVDGSYLYAGARRGYRNGFLIDPKLDPHPARAVLRVLVDAALDTANARGLDGVAWFFLTAAGMNHLDDIGDARLDAVLQNAEAEIQLPGDAFDDYLASLRSHARRRARKEIETFSAAGWRVTEEHLTDVAEEIAPLLAKVEQRYGHEASTTSLAIGLLRQARYLDDQSIVFACREGGDLVAASLMYVWHDAMWGRLVGFDYGRLRNAYEYFNLAYYTPIHYLLRSGLRRLHLGIESMEAKVRRGASVRPLWLALLSGTNGMRTRRILAREPPAWRSLRAAHPTAFSSHEWARVDDALQPSRHAG